MPTQLELTPSSLKRKREPLEHEAAVDTKITPAVACFANAGFSSTPKKLNGKRRSLSRISKENTNPFWQNACLETKSISDLAAAKQTSTAAVAKDNKEATLPTANPYEVVRKPPKKKKREEEIAEACFENPALNLELPEKQFNPYEVVRQPLNIPKATANACFVNDALNLRVQDAPAIRNPFEIQRNAETQSVAAPPAAATTGLSVAQPTRLILGIPFTPTVGCRIDFNNLQLNELTPSKMLAEKLIFSPMPAKEKRSLGGISEESSSSMDIGKELDQYQLELENSINEAKLRKTGKDADDIDDAGLLVRKQSTTVFAQKLTEISEEVEEEEVDKECLPETHISKTTTEIAIQIEQHVEQVVLQKQVEETAAKTEEQYMHFAADAALEDDSLEFKAPTTFVRAYRRDVAPKLNISKESLNLNKSENCNVAVAADCEEQQKSTNMKSMLRKSIRKLMHPAKMHTEAATNEQQQTNNNNNIKQAITVATAQDVAYASDSEMEDDEIDFKAPAPFVRAYRRAPNLLSSKESLNSNKSDKSLNAVNKPEVEHSKETTHFKSMIRKSIRKLLHPGKSATAESAAVAAEKNEVAEDKPTNEKHGSTAGHIISSIRQSLRRKPAGRQLLIEDEDAQNSIWSTAAAPAADISIIDSSERTMKFKSNAAQTEYLRIEQLTNEKKRSLRRSTREVRQQLMKSVFQKKQDAYQFEK